jgi:hypothetical protein
MHGREPEERVSLGAHRTARRRHLFTGRGPPSIWRAMQGERSRRRSGSYAGRAGGASGVQIGAPQMVRAHPEDRMGARNILVLEVSGGLEESG